MTFWNDSTFTRTSSVQGLPVILKWHYLQSLDKALDLLIEFKFCESDFYFLNGSKNCMVATYNFGSVYKKTYDNNLRDKFKAIRNKVVNEIRKSKKEYFDKLEQLLSNESASSKIFWKTSKQILNLNKTSTNIPTLILNDETAEDDYQKSNMLNNYFASQSHINDDNKTLPAPTQIQHEELAHIDITQQDVIDVLSNLNVTKACGPDLISPRLLKEGASVISKPLSMIFNRSLQQGYFPARWKEANVTPIYKKEDISSPSNYRPISLLSCIGKTMERCVHKHLYNYISQNNLLTPLQSGFISGDSTTNQLLNIYHMFCEAVDNGKEVRVVFCDISKAFDRVWHKGLLFKLAAIGCSKSLLRWFTSYLSGRRQRVVINGMISDWASIFAGVPQGSILGPLLFLIFINDIVNNIQSNIRLFADDTSLYIIVENPNTAALTLNSDLGTIHHWADNWLVDFNPTKTTSLLISRKRIPETHPTLKMNNTDLSEKTTHKHLGITFNNSCTWSDHVKNIVEKAWPRLNLLRALKFKLRRHALERMYISFIRPLIEYSDAVWDNRSTESKKQLDLIHHEAAKIITGGTKLCSIQKLLSELGWETLQERRSKHKLVIFYKIINGLTPDYLSDLLPPIVQDNVTYNLRNANNMRSLRARTNLYFNSFFPSTIRAWNELPDETKGASTVSAFKYQLNKHKKPPPMYFHAGTRKGQILHTRIRMECSSLNSHLYSKNIINSPSCSCGGFESAYHFFFICPIYRHTRNIYLSDVLQTHKTHELLYGKETATDLENEALFLKVQDFIIHSKRFD